MKYNFSAGPSIIDNSVLNKAIGLINNDNKLSYLEISHRGNVIDSLFDETKTLIRKLMKLEDKYEVLFLHGGARLQNTMIPYNIKINETANYIDTGIWSKKSIEESEIIRQTNVIASSKDKSYSYIPREINWDGKGYLHITSNNTVNGTQYNDFDLYTSKGVVIADMSSDILSRDINYNKFGMIYAGLQKNLGTAGASLVVIDKNLIDDSLKIPSMLSYKEHIKANSMLNTPPVFPVLMCNLVLKWIEEQGGISSVEKVNNEKAKLLYNELDNNSLFDTYVKGKDRSKMNVTFKLKDESLNDSFEKYMNENNIVGYKGHRSKGGYRVSLYNMLPLSHVEYLVEKLAQFKA